MPFDDHDDRLFRSHFARVNRLADRAYDDVRGAYAVGREAAGAERYAGRPFEAIETDLENGWLNVRVRGGEWASVREFARAGFDRARQGRIPDAPPAGERANLPSFADPVADAIDPTSPESPEHF